MASLITVAFEAEQGLWSGASRPTARSRAWCRARASVRGSLPRPGPSRALEMRVRSEREIALVSGLELCQ